MKKCAVIYNPVSGRKVEYKFMPQFVNILKEYGYDSQIIYTDHRGHATELVRNLEPVDLVLSMGGDGTFNESITGNFQREDRLVCAHIPCGTTNDIGVMMGYTKNLTNNLRMTLEGEIKKVDLCLINNQPFIYVAANGKFADIPYDTPRELKKKFGYLAYISKAFNSFLTPTKLTDIIYEIDGVEHHGGFSFIIISNANRISGINNFYKDIKLDDNKFEVLLCDISKRVEILKSLSLLSLYDASKVPGIYSFKAKNLRIKYQGERPKNWCIDGEKLLDNPNEYNFTIDNNIEMMVPKKNVKKLFLHR